MFCRIAALDQHLCANISVNSKRYSKIFYGKNQGPRGNCLAKKPVAEYCKKIIPRPCFSIENKFVLKCRDKHILQ
jgi:hypothetical protein